MMQFVRYYPVVIAELWFSGSVWSMVHRFLSAPSIRVLWASGMLHASKHTWLCDFCLVMDQSVTHFAVLPGADAAKDHWQSAVKELPVTGDGQTFQRTRERERTLEIGFVD